MATYTPNNNLKKPDGTDYVRVADFNENADIVDSALGDLGQLGTPNKYSLVAAINDAKEMGGGRPPYFDPETETWWEWDQGLVEYVDTGRPASANVDVDSTVTLAPGSNANVENVGTGLDVKLKFEIPRGDKGDIGETGPRGETGAGLALLGHFATLADLQTAHPTGNPGDMYSVGTTTPHDVYQWNDSTSAWVNEGPMGSGSGTVKSVNTLSPDEDGDITLTAADIPINETPGASNVVTALGTKLPKPTVVTSFNDLPTQGLYTGDMTSEGNPDSTFWSAVFDMGLANNPVYSTQIAVGGATMGMFFRYKSTTWKDWKRVCYTPQAGYGPQTWNTATLINGVTGTLYYTRVNGVVHVHGVDIVRNSTSGGIQIATLPTGFKPTRGFVVADVYVRGSQGPGPQVMLIDSSGGVSIYANGTTPLSSSSQLVFYMSYLAEQ